MEFEVHITVLSNNKDKFVTDCKNIGVKPIIINMENVKEVQVMSSSKHKSTSYKFILDNLISKFKNLGYDILRVKVEKNPDIIKDNEHIYYESHLRVFVDNPEQKNILVDKVKTLGHHISNNAFKKDYYMITIREYDISLNSFKNIIEQAKTYLSEFTIDKIEVEEAIYDTNINIDNNWIKNV